MAAERLFTMLYEIIDSFPKELVSMVIDYCSFAPVHQIDKYNLPKSNSAWNKLVILCEQPLRAVLFRSDSLYFINACGDSLISLDDNDSTYTSLIRANDHGFFVAVNNDQIRYYDINPNLDKIWTLKYVSGYKSTIIRQDENTLIFGCHTLDINTGKFVYNKWVTPVVHLFQNGSIVVEDFLGVCHIIDKSGKIIRSALKINLYNKIVDGKKLYIYSSVNNRINEHLENGALSLYDVIDNYGNMPAIFINQNRRIIIKDNIMIGKNMSTNLTWTKTLDSNIRDIQCVKDGVYVLVKEKILYLENWLI